MANPRSEPRSLHHHHPHPVRSVILGVPLDNLGGSPQRVRGALASFLQSDRPHLVVTPNAEFVMTAHRDPTFRSILLRSDLALPDGIGVTFAARWLTGRHIPRFPGPELLEELFTVAERLGSRTFLLGGAPGVARDAARAIVRHHPNLMIVGTESGYRGWGWRVSKRDLALRIAATHPEVLIVALGAPRQEKWIAHHLWQLPTVRVAIGVGGALDFLAGRVRRAPRLFRTLGLEWLWRFAIQPWRWSRILTATVRFSWVAFWGKFRPRTTAAW